jgi:hypothetical protein
MVALLVLAVEEAHGEAGGFRNLSAHLHLLRLWQLFRCVWRIQCALKVHVLHLGPLRLEQAVETAPTAHTKV